MHVLPFSYGWLQHSRIILWKVYYIFRKRARGLRIFSVGIRTAPPGFWGGRRIAPQKIRTDRKFLYTFSQKCGILMRYMCGPGGGLRRLTDFFSGSCGVSRDEIILKTESDLHSGRQSLSSARSGARKFERLSPVLLRCAFYSRILTVFDKTE